MNDRKLVVVWICHFTTEEIQQRLKPRRFVPQFAPWISNTIPEFEDQDKVQLYIISPHRYISGIKKFEIRGVKYVFYNAGIPFWGRHWPGFFKWDAYTQYKGVSNLVKRLVDKIKPDIIHLQGAENPYYSATVIQFLNKYPVIVNLQRMNLDFHFGSSIEARLREKIERQILTKFRDFSIRTTTMQSDLLLFNPMAETYWVRYRMPSIMPIESAKEYDVVFFARVSPTKGIEDLLEAAKVIASRLGSLKLCIIGGIDDSYKQCLIKRFSNERMSITWKGLLPTLDDVHKEASKAMVSVLPTHQDIIPGTIVESMMLGLPVVSYNVGSIPELNQSGESVLLSPKGDIEGLANNIVRILTDQEFAAKLVKQAHQTVRTLLCGDDILEEHLACYKEVIMKFKSRKDHDKRSAKTK